MSKGKRDNISNEDALYELIQLSKTRIVIPKSEVVDYHNKIESIEKRIA